MRARKRRSISIALRALLFAIAATVLALRGPHVFASYTSAGAAGLIAALAVLAMVLRIDAPLLSMVHRRRRYPEPGRLPLELAVTLTIFTVYGPIAAASVAFVGYALAIPAEGRPRFTLRLLDGGAAAVMWLALGALRSATLPASPVLGAAAFFEFTALYFAAIFAFLLAVWLPLHALSQRSLSVVRLWRTLARDTRFAAYMLLTIAWAYVCAQVWLRAGVALGVAAFAPLPFLGAAMRSLHDHRLDLHRLRLARDAVQAMLRTRDPLPQMNSLLASLHTPAAEETLQIYAAISPSDPHLSPLATIGPIPEAAQLQGVRGALLRLQQRDGAASTQQRTRRHSITAYAVRTSDDQLLGALVIHRLARTASLLPARRFTQAATELAPLLRDFRAIAATQSAAALDALTGLGNRRTIMEQLRVQIEQADGGNPCAVLILDIDHFKAINDTLGHQAGDKCLRAVGQLLARSIRSIDRAGRIGGEEFVVLMPDTTSEMARAVGERLRAAIENAGFHHADGRAVTASIGVAVAAVSDTVDSLLARADGALYRAKREGRNRVIEESA